MTDKERIIRLENMLEALMDYLNVVYAAHDIAEVPFFQVGKIYPKESS